MKFASNTIAITSLILSNLVPLIGVIFYDWSVSQIMFLYWAESAIIGYFTIKKMLKSEHKPDTSPFPTIHTAKTFYIPFFTLHYGMFMFVHLIFLLIFFARYGINMSGFLLGLFSLFISHLVSYQTNFISNQEYLRTGPELEMFKPYGRIIVMHLTVIGSGFFVFGSGGATWAVGLLVVVKTVIDLLSHLWEHTSRRLLA